MHFDDFEAQHNGTVANEISTNFKIEKEREWKTHFDKFKTVFIRSFTRSLCKYLWSVVLCMRSHRYCVRRVVSRESILRCHHYYRCRHRSRRNEKNVKKVIENQKYFVRCRECGTHRTLMHYKFYILACLRTHYPRTSLRLRSYVAKKKKTDDASYCR